LLKEIKSHLLINYNDYVLEGGLPLSPSWASMVLKNFKSEPKVNDFPSGNGKIKWKGARSAAMAEEWDFGPSDWRTIVYIE
jgi:hypothetical protein